MATIKKIEGAAIAKVKKLEGALKAKIKKFMGIAPPAAGGGYTVSDGGSMSPSAAAGSYSAYATFNGQTQYKHASATYYLSWVNSSPMTEMHGWYIEATGAPTVGIAGFAKYTTNPALITGNYNGGGAGYSGVATVA